MRIAILILAILGSLIAFGGAACATACASCFAAADEGMSDLQKQIEKQNTKLNQKQKAEMANATNDLSEATTSFALTAVSYGLMGIMGLVGGILGFIKLGKGEPATIGGGLMAGGIVLGMILGMVGTGAGAIISTILFGGEFLGIAAILAFVAKPEDPGAAAAQPSQYPQHQMPPGQYPQQPGQYPQQQQPPPGQYPPQA